MKYKNCTCDFDGGSHRERIRKTDPFSSECVVRKWVKYLTIAMRCDAVSRIRTIGGVTYKAGVRPWCPAPKSSQKDSGSVGWYLRVTHSDARATVTHIHILDRRTVGTTHPPHSACCCVTEAFCYLVNTTRHGHEVSVRFCRNYL